MFVVNDEESKASVKSKIETTIEQMDIRDSKAASETEKAYELVNACP